MISDEGYGGINKYSHCDEDTSVFVDLETP